MNIILSIKYNINTYIWLLGLHIATMRNECHISDHKFDLNLDIECMYGIMTVELVIREIRIDEAAG